MLLTDAERKRFTEWLRNEAASTKIILEQAKKISIPESLLKLYRLEMLACELIAAKLEKTESATIG